MNSAFARVCLLCFLFVPTTAWAWGPAAHIEFALQILIEGSLLAPAILKLLKEKRDHFIYGNLAADAIIGKNRVAAHDHCHSFSVARKLLQKSEQDPKSHAFMLGYMGHLGADIVAHNQFVPQMMITHFRKKRAGHLYWETRADQRMYQFDSGIGDTWAELTKQNFRPHERFLSQELTRSILNNHISTAIYKRNLKIQLTTHWRRAINSYDTRSPLYLSDTDIVNWREASIRVMANVINDPYSSKLNEMDPVGHTALEEATKTRKQLRATHK